VFLIFQAVTTTVQTVQYTVTDYYGTQVAAGTFPLKGTTPYRLTLGANYPTGMYSVHLVSSAGPTQDDAFCVIPPPDTAPGDYSIFSWHYCDDAPEDWAALAQMGCRVIRRDMGWPNVEPSQGTFDMTLPHRLAGLCQQYGMQCIPLVGYCPPWNGMPPLDGAGRSAVATHTWAPNTTTDWQAYMHTLVGYFDSQSLSWPTPMVVHPTQTVQNALPVVQSWEIWNECDQGFYYGYWGRYLDLLRIAWNEVKAGDLWGTVIYGGSCGHWTQLGWTYQENCQYFYDRLNLHPGTDMDVSLPVWFTGCPQIGNGYGMYRDSSFTESYPYAPTGITYAQYMLRLYATLRQWRLGTYCMASGWTESSSASDDGGLLQRSGNDLLPKARYVATANARWQLGCAHYVGPLNLGAGVQADMFLRSGRPLLVAWASQPTTVTLNATPGAYTMDEMGTHTPLTLAADGTVQLTLGTGADGVYGLDPNYLADALLNQSEIYLTTQQGFPTTIVFGYIGPLETDAASYGATPGWPADFRAQVATAVGLMRSNPLAAERALYNVQSEVLAEILTVQHNGPTSMGSGTNHHIQSVVYRLQILSEWLGEVADAYTWRWGPWLAPSASVDQLRQSVESERQTLTPAASGLTYPVSLLTLRRAKASLDQTNGGAMGQGAYRAALGELYEAQLYAQTEVPVQTGIVATADFVNADQMVKNLALVPGQQQELRVYVYNYTNQPVSGTLTWTTPASWGIPAGSLSAPFTAPAGGHSAPASVFLTIPAGTAPWVTQTAPQGETMSVPPGLEPEPDITLNATLSDGRELLPMPYSILVGSPVLPTS
jgi:hypothetical protein